MDDVLGGRRRSSRHQSTVGEILESLDAFPKTLEDFKERSQRGGWWSLAIGIVILTLLVSEIVNFTKHEEVTTLRVEDSSGTQLSIYIDIDFPELPCAKIGIDAVDASGRIQLEVEHDLFKTPINSRYAQYGGAQAKKAFQLHRMMPEGLPEDYCGSCYGASGPIRKCCNTCADVKAAYRENGLVLKKLDVIEQCVREGEVGKDNAEIVGGCNVRGFLKVAKVGGNFHISPSHTVAFHGINIHDISAFMSKTGVNLTHTIHQFNIGTPVDFNEGSSSNKRGRKKRKKPQWNYETSNPLDKVTKVATEMGQYDYFLKVVPTSLSKGFRFVEFEQYSVTENFKPVQFKDNRFNLPGLFFYYEMNPIRVDVYYVRPSLFHFFVQTCAIIGGVFTVSNLLNELIEYVTKILSPMVRKRF
mmetsp:Transcript_12508/g.38190  ORF Transcript_12508/g.38190 Transcript_12508/m.38190 type:complete len:415 (-) Transcript_12508:1614-2858(-)|eukprot:CAMPEP_0198723508 /NCGR_PEP_ID=MMETSP1475-20131203/1018_1 /TAXON_ID= ORGANISM="Unidentified sp., Strain CCMP1999" /NCGR_SAMPLE_ID=MMETSP1475 /ASSEMBLY_ACC=CAM_ASM_001111 /LENGTH=414 /DNA_ID=CAMNT_0044484659 /DNA_START=55 /DNA_END=1299 /DNA_ORIENTATION=+